MTAGLVTLDLDFNPRSREGSDAFVPLRCFQQKEFQSSLPRGERHLQVSHYYINHHDFNPRSREGSDCIRLHKIICKNISILAPARGATVKAPGFDPGREDFNPRSREGSDDDKVFTGQLNIAISILAPARGATIMGPFSALASGISILAPARGATQCQQMHASKS